MPPPGHVSTSFPVSVKGVVIRDGLVVLLKNERQEWELPGGRIEVGETPAQCLTREIVEETRWVVTPGPILDAWLYHVVPGRHVFVIAYGCYLDRGPDPVLSEEHTEIGLFTKEEVPGLVMPEGYKTSIAMWFDQLQRDAVGRVG